MATTDITDIEFFTMIHNLHQSARDEFDNATMTQTILLHHIASNEGCSQTDLVGKTGVDRSTLADTIRRMMREGVVTRKRTKEDARRYALKLTAEGLRLYEAGIEELAKARENVQRRYPKLNAKALTPVLQEAAE